jgi:mercuric ion binding protein
MSEANSDSQEKGAKMKPYAMLTGTVILLTWTLPAAADTKIDLKQVHMCCPGCAEDVAEVLQKVSGVKNVACDQKTKTARFTATDTKVAQRALDALAEAGFHGATGTKDYAFKEDSGVKAGKVKSLTVTGFHNTCPGCVRSFREAIKAVPGVTGDNAKSAVTTCQVTGEFEAVALVEALNKAGFHVKVRP